MKKWLCIFLLFPWLVQAQSSYPSKPVKVLSLIHI